jgi:hypothetical protein
MKKLSSLTIIAVVLASASAFAQTSAKTAAGRA